MKYTCPRCHYSTCRKSSMEVHLHRRYGCEPLYSTDALPASVDQCKDDVHQKQPQPQTYRCKHNCGKSFNHASSLSRHYAVCGGNNNVPSEPPKTPNGTYQSQSVNGNNNNVTQVQINITPLSSMEPKLSHEGFTKLMKGGALDTILTMIEDEHFNPDKPEQMNIYISNLKDQIGRAYMTAKGWEVCSGEELQREVFELYSSTINTLIESTGEDIETIKKDMGNKFPHLQKQIQRWERQTDREAFDEYAQKKVGLLLYNRRDVVKEKHNLRY